MPGAWPDLCRLWVHVPVESLGPGQWGELCRDRSWGEVQGEVGATPAGEGLSWDTQGLYALDMDHRPAGQGWGRPSQSAMWAEGCQRSGAAAERAVLVGTALRAPAFCVS